MMMYPVWPYFEHSMIVTMLMFGIKWSKPKFRVTAVFVGLS